MFGKLLLTFSVEEARSWLVATTEVDAEINVVVVPVSLDDVPLVRTSWVFA